MISRVTTAPTRRWGKGNFKRGNFPSFVSNLGRTQGETRESLTQNLFSFVAFIHDLELKFYLKFNLMKLM